MQHHRLLPDAWLPSLMLLALLAQFAYCKKPNVLFVLTDDQDWHMDSAQYMRNLQELIAQEGTTYNNHYCTVALCCPSRATLWSGLAAHNHNVTDVAPPHGGYTKAVEQGLNDENLFVWMQKAGYNTHYVGKLYNFHTVDNFDKPPAKGFNGSDFLLDPYTYQYYNAKMSHNGNDPVSYAGQYSTDVVAARAQEQLAEALSHVDDSPFFLTVAPIAPHSVWVIEPENKLSYLLAPEAAERHKHLFVDYKIPRDESFNAGVDGGVGWISSLPPLNDTVLEYNDYYQRQRLRALQAVDEMLASLVEQLAEAGELDNTYIIYSTDNGYHLSQHRMLPGKECGFDTDIHIPLFMRGPGILRGSESNAVTSHTDMSSTILRIAGVEKVTDGKPMPILGSRDDEHDDFGQSEHSSIEYWGPAIPEGYFGTRTDLDREAGKWSMFWANNTYKGVRLIGRDYNLYYSVWCTNETELYDLKADPFQVKNLAVDLSTYDSVTIAGRSLTQALPRLDALMMVLKTCKGHRCTAPWESLHPQGDVHTLSQALDTRFDAFYHQQPKMMFYGCSRAYWAEMESQQPVSRYGDTGALVDQTFDYANHWHLLT